VGTKEGTLDVLDVGASSRLQSVKAHAGAVWSLAALPDNRYALEGHGQQQPCCGTHYCMSRRALELLMVQSVWHTVWHV